MELSELWAKTEPFQSVLTHGTATGIIAQVVFRNVLASGNRKLLEEMVGMSRDLLEQFVGYWASLHDIGKITSAFQGKDPAMADRLRQEGLYDNGFDAKTVRHEKDSIKILSRIWTTQKTKRGAIRFFASLIGAHHQGKPYISSKIGTKWEPLQDEFEASMRQKFMDGDVKIPVVAEEKKGTVAALLLGILILADWIASGEAFEDVERVLAEESGENQIQLRAERFFLQRGWGNAGA